MARSQEELGVLLRRIDGRGYRAYRDLAGEWSVAEFTLHLDHIQGDPFAPPSRVRLSVPARSAGFDARYRANGSRTLGLANLLARVFARETARRSRGRSTGGSGAIRMEAPGQEVLPQTAVHMHPDGGVEARFTVGLPARGRRILGLLAEEMLTRDVPAIARASLLAEAHAPDLLWQHVTVNEDADALRAVLASRGLVAFVADGAILPRRSGVDDRPLDRASAVPFSAPPSLRVGVDLPHGGHVTGMGVPAGVTLIVGGGFHGKSTLLRAIERGVYNHRPGDGRERVVAVEGLVKIRAEDGRGVRGVDISPFIDNLPLGQPTRGFSTQNASGSTSQAAAIVEALEAGASGLLTDEDTAATNFMIRDARMQRLVPREREPITPFVDRVRQLYAERGVSTILVIGGSGDYLDVADTVIALDAFQPRDVGERARQVARDQPTGRRGEAVTPLSPRLHRRPQPGSLDPSKGRRRIHIRARGAHGLRYGEAEIDLSALDQLLCPAQTRAIGAAIHFAQENFVDGRRTLAEILDRVMAAIEAAGLDVLDPRRVGDLAGFRRHELAAAINRLRSLAVADSGAGGE